MMIGRRRPAGRPVVTDGAARPSTGGAVQPPNDGAANYRSRGAPVVTGRPQARRIGRHGWRPPENADVRGT